MTADNKPRLKLHLSGQRVRLVRYASLGWSAKEARRAVARHHKDLLGLAVFLGVDYMRVCSATNSDNPCLLDCTGVRREVRAMLGLALTEPSPRKILMTEVHAKRRATRIATARPDWVFGQN